METKKKNLIGIDLGTTFSEVAVITESGTVVVIADQNGDLKVPSIVSYAAEKPLAGRFAIPDLITTPEFVARCTKRYIGKVTDANEPIPVLSTPSGRPITPVDAARDLLAYLKKCVEDYLGVEVEAAVITVPAYFDEVARMHTKQAGHQAGFSEVKIIDEPLAAALYYGLEKDRQETTVVADFGGGTLDLTCIQISGSKINAILTTGDSELGGSNYDELLLQWEMAQAGKEGVVISADDPATMHQNLEHCREAKELLAGRDEVSIIAEANGKRARLPLTREVLRQTCRELDERYIQCCQEMYSLLKQKAIRPDRILLVGGSSRMFHVPEMIQQVFSLEPCRDADPDFVVSKGAVIWAHKSFGDDNQSIVVGKWRYLPSRIEMHTVAAHAICIAVVDRDRGMERYNHAIVPANIPLPHSFQERFSPLDPRQNQIQVEIVQGKHGDLSSQSTSLRVVHVPIQSCQDDLERIKIVGQYTEEGLLEFTVIDDLLGKPITDSFVYRPGLGQGNP